MVFFPSMLNRKCVWSSVICRNVYWLVSSLLWLWVWNAWVPTTYLPFFHEQKHNRSAKRGERDGKNHKIYKVEGAEKWYDWRYAYSFTGWSLLQSEPVAALGRILTKHIEYLLSTRDYYLLETQKFPLTFR